MNQERLSPIFHRVIKNQPSSSSRFHAEYDSDNDVKTVDILSLETIRSTLVRQGNITSIRFITIDWIIHFESTMVSYPWRASLSKYYLSI